MSRRAKKAHAHYKLQVASQIDPCLDIWSAVFFLLPDTLCAHQDDQNASSLSFSERTLIDRGNRTSNANQSQQGRFPMTWSVGNKTWDSILVKTLAMN